MTKGIFLAALVVVAFAAALLTHVGESGASFHLTRIDGAMAGANGNSTIQYVELRSAALGQNLVETHVICFYDSTGTPYAEFKFPMGVSNPADGASILVGSTAFDAAWAAGAPDFNFTFSPANTTAIAGGADTDHPIRSPSGKISFGSDFTATPSLMCQGSFFQVDSVAYGAGYSGLVDYGTKFASDLPTSSTSGLHLQGPVCIEASAHLCSSPRDNSVNYAIVDENAAVNQPRNNANLSGPICPRNWPVPPGDDDCDGFTTAIENFIGTDPLVACAATPIANDEPPPDKWPVDFNDDQKATLSDVLKYSPVFNTTGPGLPYQVRFDLNGDNHISLSDVLKFSPFFNQSCAP